MNDEQDERGLDVIAFGTGRFGKMAIPYLLHKDPVLRLHGVSNSRVAAEDGGAFLDTGLPLRSIDAWAKIIPDVTVMITASDKYNAEIVDICKKARIKRVVLTQEWLEQVYTRYFKEIGGTISTESISLGRLKLLNPFTSDNIQDYLYDFLLELGDFILPHYDKNWMYVEEGLYAHVPQ